MYMHKIKLKELSNTFTVVIFHGESFDKTNRTCSRSIKIKNHTFEETIARKACLNKQHFYVENTKQSKLFF